ncbi:hypothetical protein COCNU_01G017290 [Cocos nucifera]|uniref:Uncharacterized protein n=1 Tax=Cocos nucifera TaxID=13894 RepID=A0A8K0HWD8_COCNU|nr:hypothetical protein COCNU_01G017290 [Cocos nucifera]
MPPPIALLLRHFSNSRFCCRGLLKMSPLNRVPGWKFLLELEVLSPSCFS